MPHRVIGHFGLLLWWHKQADVETCFSEHVAAIVAIQPSLQRKAMDPAILGFLHSINDPNMVPLKMAVKQSGSLYSSLFTAMGLSNDPRKNGPTFHR